MRPGGRVRRERRDGRESPDARPVDTASVPAGTCRFTLRNGTERTTFEGNARARMNGSGNLLVECRQADGGAALARFGIGNATFDGPRMYKADDFTSDGTIDYTASRGIDYSSSERGASCTLVLAEAAPLDARGDSVVKGGRVAATFTCVSIIAATSRTSPSSYSVEDGSLAAIVE